MTLSERHINGYDSAADPEPAPHKDRYASQISVGLSIDIPAGSQLVIYPYDHLELNPFNTAADLYDSLPAHEKPEVVVRSAREVVIDDRPGDVVVFHGNCTWHLRRNSADSYNLYFKFNDFDCDPLGEDPATPARREATLAALGSAESASCTRSCPGGWTRWRARMPAMSGGRRRCARSSGAAPRPR